MHQKTAVCLRSRSTPSALAAYVAVGVSRRARDWIGADRHGGHRPAPRRRRHARSRPGAVHDRAAREHVVWRSSGWRHGIATQVAVSPDGRNIVFVAGAPPAYQIWLRPVAALAARPIPGTEGGTFPFWSPDSRFIGFFAGGKLKKVAIAGGPPIVLCDAPAGRGGSWSRDNVILFAPGVRPHRPPARVKRRRGADRRHDTRSSDRRRRPPVAALSARWPALLLHRDHRTLLSCVEAVDDQNWLARPGRRRHHASSGRVIGVIRLRPCGVRPRRDPDGAAVRS